MAVTRINNNQVTNAASGNVAAGINAAVKIQAYSIVSQNLANDIVIGNSLTVTGELITANISTDNYLWANGNAINFSSITYGNANVAAYLPSYTGSLYPGEILTDNYYWGNGAPVVFGNTLSGAFVGDQQFSGDGVNTAFTMSQVCASSAMLVAINGITQYPGVAYTTSGSTITFTTAPLTTDYIDIRYFGEGTGNGTGNYGNANVAAYLPTYTGNITAGNILTDNYLWANGVPINFGNTLTGMFVADQQFWGTGSPVYVLNQAVTDPSSVVVSINGVVQAPGAAYTTASGFITFSNPVSGGDYVDIRFMGSTDSANLVAGNVFSNNYYWANGAPYINGNVTVVNGIILGDQQFVGNGSTTYPLSSATSASTVVVSINGVVQLPYQAYSTAGNTITFTNPVNVGDAVDVRYFGDANTISLYGDANVEALLEGGTLANNIITTGDVTANDFFGNALVTVGNISGNYYFGNGAFLTGVQTSTGNSATFLRVQQNSGYGQLITAIPQAVLFPYQDAVAGNAISYSNGTFTLQPGLTYRLRGSVGGFGTMGEAPPYLRYQWMDVTNNAVLGQTARVDGVTPQTQWVGGSSGGTAEAIFAPLTVTDVQLQIIDDAWGEVYFTVGGDSQGESFADIQVLDGVVTSSGNYGVADGSTVAPITVTGSGALNVRLNGTDPEILSTAAGIDFVYSGTTNNGGVVTGQQNTITNITASTWTALDSPGLVSTGDSAIYLITDTTNNLVYRLSYMLVGASAATLTVERLV